ncbi:MAG: formylglycine-generating enzyme family protein [Planctomycetota bacterium]
MKRLVCLVLAASLASPYSIDAQDPKDPPKEFTNSIGMKFVWIPPGTFLMGSPKEEKHRNPIETQHKVTLTKGFYMGVYAVTQDQWVKVMGGKNPSDFPKERWTGKDKLSDKEQALLPVESVSWNDCQEFLKKLRETDAKPYRLPTEAEWEYACRAGTTTPFHFGETLSTDQANYDGDQVYGNGKKGVRRSKTTPGGSFPANAFGLHDMHGNLYQWCQDWYGDYPQGDVTDPQGPEKGQARVLRGGSWKSSPVSCRSAERLWYEPGARFHLYGFRVCFFSNE